MIYKMNTRELLDISAELSTERDISKLFIKILKQAIRITNCSAGHIYLYGDEALKLKAMVEVKNGNFIERNNSELELTRILMNRNDVRSFAVMEKMAIRISDIYNSNEYDFSDYEEYDEGYHYKTTSLLIAPMINYYGEIIGVLQLINAKDKKGNIVSFDAKYEDIIMSFVSLAVVCITNVSRLGEVKTLLDSFISAISSAIDKRTPYNASHTRNMVGYAKKFLEYMNRKYIEETGNVFFTESREEEFLMSVWLHDMGKMAIPTKIMNKKTRLGEDFYKVQERFNQMILLNEIKYLKKDIQEEEFSKNEKEIRRGLELITSINTGGKLQSCMIHEIGLLAKKKYLDYEGVEQCWITPMELDMLKITKGTLNEAERQIMESHVVITKALLEEINFTNDFKHVSEWASSHHEFLDGSGYPQKLRGDQLTIEMRLLTVLDIFDALTATDRPYKKPIPIKKSLEILENMAKEGKLDKNLVMAFAKSEAWTINENLE